MEGQQVIHCKQCGSNKIKVQGGKGTLIVSSLLMISFGIWIPIIGWFLMIPLGLVLLVIGLLSLLQKTTNRSVKCLECRHITRVDIEVYEIYKQAIS